MLYLHDTRENHYSTNFLWKMHFISVVRRTSGLCVYHYILSGFDGSLFTFRDHKIIGAIKRSTGKIIFLQGDALTTRQRLLNMSFIYIVILFHFLLGILSPSRISSRIFRIH